MASGREELLFQDFKRRPSRDTLTALLRGHQDHIYNICFQVLRQPEDAEDVSQEVLLEVTQGISRIGAPRPFKVWLYRVALHSSLNHKQARARRVALARKVAAGTLSEGAPVDSEDRAELMRAIGELDDPTRCLLLEHYFDKLTLEEIGAREGVSSVAVWKRIDRAKETLRRALLTAGFGAAAGGVAQALESVTPVAAPASLAAKSALIAGGVVMGTKSAVTGGTIVAALLIAGAAATGGFVAGNGRAASRVRDLEDHVARLSRVMPNAAGVSPHAAFPIESQAPAREVPVEKPETSATDTKGPARKLESAPDATPVKYGRPPKPNLDELINAESWDEFYRKVKEVKRLGSEALENLIFQRVTRELRLDADDSQAIRKLFEIERGEATRAIVESAGGPAGFSKIKDDLGMNWKTLYDDWIRQREIVRRTYDIDYQKLLTYDQLQFFNEHLRNTEINLESSYSGEGRYHLIGGVGKK